MMLQTVGGSRLVELMRLDQPRERDTEWLLFGPTDPTVVEAPEPPPQRGSPPVSIS
ncbi:hypothetical protein [Phenylobacterium sp.]|uniref:hypothetical protein n=1 Tax=Phenylobacterium sp. TaxID=1871053 RepID=UPI002F3F31ED